jgi:hypothetical protein
MALHCTSSNPSELLAPAFRMGVTEGLPADLYHGEVTSISKSGLDAIARSPYHYWARYLNVQRPADEPTPAMFAGTLGHCAILEPGEFDARYAVGPDVHHATKAWKDFMASLPPGRLAITPEQASTAMAQAASVRTHPVLREVLATGRAEVSAKWVDEETGAICKCRPDFLYPVGDEGGVIIVDVKTTVSAQAEAFARSVATFRYHVAAAFYSDGFEIASGCQVHGFLLAAVEAKYPFAAAAFMLDEQALDLGRTEYRRNLRTYAQCSRDNAWPGYPESVQLLSLPRWATFNLDSQP